MLKSGIIVIIAAVCGLSGCATVSVIPGAGPVEKTVSVEQSDLRDAAAEFTREATERHWIAQDRGFLQFARILAHGHDKASLSEAKQDGYAETIGIGQRSSSSIALSLSADVNDASALLSELSHAAQVFLATDRADRNTTSRTDLVSFERTLVQAQKVRRTFTSVLPALGKTDMSSVDAAMEKFDRQVDRASEIADRLAREYINRDAQAVS